MAGRRENGPLLSRVVDPPGTKGGPRAGNFPSPSKNTFCPGWWLHPGQKRGPLYMSLLPPPSSNTWAFLICAAPPSSLIRASCSAAVPERRPSSAASTPRPPWTMTPPGRSPVRRHPRPRATSSLPPRPTLRARPCLRRPRWPPMHAAAPPPSPLRATPPPVSLVVQGRRPRFPRPV